MISPISHRNPWDKMGRKHETSFLKLQVLMTDGSWTSPSRCTQTLQISKCKATPSIGPVVLKVPGICFKISVCIVSDTDVDIANRKVWYTLSP